MDWITATTLVCIILCFIIIGIQINAHLSNYTNPLFQKWIIMILLMPPIYALLSSFSIWFSDQHGYLLLIRDIYESIVIFSFFELLNAYVAYVDGCRLEENKTYETLGRKGVHPHSFPVNYVLPPLKLTSSDEGRKVFLTCKTGILQYIPLKFICAILIIFDYLAWFWEPGNEVVYVLCTVIVGISVTIALYWLIFFYHILHEELAPYKPLLKFVTIKGILFLTFWQEIILGLFSVKLSHARFMPPQDRNDADQVFSSLLVNFEMVIMSILTAVAYSYKDFVRGEAKVANLKQVLKSNIDETWGQVQEMVHVKKSENNTE